MFVYLFDSVLYVLLVVFYPSFYVGLVLKKTETGSASGPVLFTSCKMVYKEILDDKPHCKNEYALSNQKKKWQQIASNIINKLELSNN